MNFFIIIISTPFIQKDIMHVNWLQLSDINMRNRKET